MPDPAPRLPRVSVRGLLVLVVLAALLLGWASSERRAARERRIQEDRLRYAEEELRRARDEVRDLSRGIRADPSRSFWQAGLDGSNLARMTIVSDANAFQRASFRRGILEGARLEGGDASFQHARFDGAKLARATLKGEGSSFQAATFDGADLTAATLQGGPSSFQGASFEGATLVNATLIGSFGGANLSAARLEGADLTAIAPADLAGCHFRVPPTFNAATRFPPGFDPAERGWARVP